jgi:hypothetical protein
VEWKEAEETKAQETSEPDESNRRKRPSSRNVVEHAQEEPHNLETSMKPEVETKIVLYL